MRGLSPMREGVGVMASSPLITPRRRSRCLLPQNSHLSIGIVICSLSYWKPPFLEEERMLIFIGSAPSALLSIIALGLKLGGFWEALYLISGVHAGRGLQVTCEPVRHLTQHHHFSHTVVTCSLDGIIQLYKVQLQAGHFLGWEDG